MMIDLIQLRTFVAVAEERHLTRASERLHLSQSAASNHVRAVEETLEKQLFVRTNRNLELTHAGEMLLGRAKQLLNEASQFTSFARELQGKLEGTLRIGAGGELGTGIAKIIARLKQLHPLIKVELVARTSLNTRQGLKTGELDVGAILGNVVELGFSLHELTTVPFRVVGPVSWKDRIEQADLAQLAAMSWITPIGSTAYVEMLAELFTNRGLELNSVANFDSAVLGRALLRAGMGMMLMREDRALKWESEGHLAISPIARIEFKLWIAHLTTRQADPLIQGFMEAAGIEWPNLRLVNSSPPAF